MESFASSMASLIPSKLLLPLLLSPSDAPDPIPLFSSSPVPAAAASDHSGAIRHLLLVVVHAVVFLLRFFVSVALSLTGNPTTFPSDDKPQTLAALRGSSHRLKASSEDAAEDNGVARALSDVLFAMMRVPVWSRKYDVVRGMAEQIIDDNVRCGNACLEAVNRAALSAAFLRTVRRVEVVISARGKGGRKADGSVERIWGGVRSTLRRWADDAEEEGAKVVGGDMDVEKLAAELLWIAEKMAVCGVAGEAVALWGSASELARLSLGAEPRLQGAFVKVSVFLFKHAKDMEGDKGEGQAAVVRSQMAILMSWLPLLCQATNGIDAPVLSSPERQETVKVLEQIIENLNRDQQEEVLTLWLHYYTSCPHSDWPNLQSCYIQWYNSTRRLLTD